MSEVRQVDEIHEVRFGGIGQLILVQGEAESLTIRAEENLLPFIETEVREGVLYIGIQDELEQRFAFQPTMPIQFLLEVNKIDTLVVSGSTILHAYKLTARKMRLECSGNGEVKIDSLITDQLSGSLSGSAYLEIAGTAPVQKIEISGNSWYIAENLRSEDVTLMKSGTAKAIVWAEEHLTLDLSGTGSVSYYGNPIFALNDIGVVQVIGLGNK